MNQLMLKCQMNPKAKTTHQGKISVNVEVENKVKQWVFDQRAKDAIGGGNYGWKD